MLLVLMQVFLGLSYMLYAIAFSICQSKLISDGLYNFFTYLSANLTKCPIFKIHDSRRLCLLIDAGVCGSIVLLDDSTNEIMLMS